MECQEQVSYCSDVEGLFSSLDIRYNGFEWYLFIGGSSTSLKAVLLHCDNTFPPIPIAYSTSLKLSYASMKKILDLVNYISYK